MYVDKELRTCLNKEFQTRVLVLGICFLFTNAFACISLTALAVWTLTGTKLQQVPISVTLLRIGITFQFVGGISLIPEIVSEIQLTTWFERIRSIYLKARAGEYFIAFVLISLLMCVPFVFLGLLVFTDSPNSSFGLAFLFILQIGIVLLSTFDRKRPYPPVLLLALLIKITEWAIKQKSMRRLIARVSFPLFMFGVLAQLISTFL